MYTVFSHDHFWFDPLYFSMQFLPVYSPSEDETDNPKLYAENVRRTVSKRVEILTIAFQLTSMLFCKNNAFHNYYPKYIVCSALNIPCGNQSVDDFILCLSARKIGLPFTTGLIAYYKATEDLGMGLSEIEKWLKRFREINTRRTGFTDAEELANYLRVPNDACLQAIVNGAITNVNVRMYVHSKLLH